MRKHYFYGVSLAMALALVLGACDKKPANQNQNHATVKIGNIVVSADTQQGGEAVALPADLPSYAAVYPGGTVKSVVTMKQPIKGTAITYTSTAKAEEIIAFYKKNAEAASLGNFSEVNLPGAWRFSAQTANTDHNLVVAITVQDGVQSVQVVYI